MELGAVEDGSDDIDDDDDDDDLAGGLQAGKYYCMARGTVALEDMIGIHYHNYCERGADPREVSEGSGRVRIISCLSICRSMLDLRNATLAMEEGIYIYIYIYQVIKTPSDMA